jgi:hypothetical protein
MQEVKPLCLFLWLDSSTFLNCLVHKAGCRTLTTEKGMPLAFFVLFMDLDVRLTLQMHHTLDLIRLRHWPHPGSNAGDGRESGTRLSSAQRYRGLPTHRSVEPSVCQMVVLIVYFSFCLFYRPFLSGLTIRVMAPTCNEAATPKGRRSMGKARQEGESLWDRRSLYQRLHEILSPNSVLRGR